MRYGDVTTRKHVMHYSSPFLGPLFAWIDVNVMMTSSNGNIFALLALCEGNPPVIGSDNGLSPIPHQAIIWTNAVLLSIRQYGTTFSEILF